MLFGRFFSESGRQQFTAVLKRVDWILVMLSILLGLTHNLVSVLRWQLVVQAKRLSGNLLQLLTYFYVGRLYNLVLPSNMGGDVVRIYRLGKLNNNMEVATASVFVERFTGMLVLLILSALSLTFSLRGAGHLFLLSFGFVLAITVVFGWAATDSRFVQLLNHIAQRFESSFLHKVSGRFETFQQSNREVGKNRAFVVKLFLFSFLFYAVAILSVWFSALAFDRSVSLTDMIIAVPVIMLIMNLPVSIGGLGLMEASYTVAFELLGYSAELGLITALVMRVKTLIDGLVGGLVELKQSL